MAGRKRRRGRVDMLSDGLLILWGQHPIVNGYEP